MNNIVLDNIDEISILTETPFKNYHILYQLREGINFVYDRAIDIEKDYWKNLYPDKDESYLKIMEKVSFSYNVETNTPVNNLFSNLFYWYSINLMNYVRIIGMIDFLNQSDYTVDQLLTHEIANYLREHTNEYISKIQELEPVEIFRNKIAAHTAISSPKTRGEKADNIATLIESMSPMPTFRNGRLFMGDFTWKKAGEVSEIGKKAWSLTENYESLTGRFDWSTSFPNEPLKI